MKPSSSSATEQPFVWPEGTYVSMAETGHCKVCGSYEDLRMGACYTCADQVAGKEIQGGHELWDSKNPSNRWKVQAS